MAAGYSGSASAASRSATSFPASAGVGPNVQKTIENRPGRARVPRTRHESRSISHAT